MTKPFLFRFTLFQIKKEKCEGSSIGSSSLIISTMAMSYKVSLRFILGLMNTFKTLTIPQGLLYCDHPLWNDF